VNEPLYVSKSRVTLVEGTHRRVLLEAGPHFETGVHGPIKRHFHLDDQPDLPLPVDFVVGATGA